MTPIKITTRQAQELANILREHDLPMTASELERLVLLAVEVKVQLVTLDKDHLISAYNHYILDA